MKPQTIRAINHLRRVDVAKQTATLWLTLEVVVPMGFYRLTRHDPAVMVTVAEVELIAKQEER